MLKEETIFVWISSAENIIISVKYAQMSNGIQWVLVQLFMVSVFALVSVPLFLLGA